MRVLRKLSLASLNLFLLENLKKFSLAKCLKSFALLVFLFSCLFIVETAMAGTGAAGSQFNDVYDILSGWVTGSLGKVLSIGMLLVGIAAGLLQQSIAAAVPALAAAIALNYGPGLISGIFTAIA